MDKKGVYTKELEEMKEIELDGYVYHQLLCVCAKNEYGLDPTEQEEEDGVNVTSRVVYKSAGGTIVIIEKGIIGSVIPVNPDTGKADYDITMYGIRLSLVYDEISDDTPFWLEEVIKSATHKSVAVVYLDATVDLYCPNTWLIESKELHERLEKNEPEDYLYFIKKYICEFSVRTEDPTYYETAGKLTHIIE